jgi:predicted amidohydrolase YtcJ
MLLVSARRIHTFSGPAIDHGAVLLRRGRIIDAGPFDAIRARAPDAAHLDLGDATLTPGLVDAHAHLLEWAIARTQVELSGAQSPEHAARDTAQHAGALADGWVLGRGWNAHLWSAAPTREMLDAALPGRAVALQSHDMHALWCSSEALRQAGVDATTADPDGGRIERADDGAPTGLLLENATRLVLDRVPVLADDAMQDAVVAAQSELHSLGITGVHAMEMPSPEFRSLRVLEALRAADRLRVRVLQHLPLTVFESALELGLRSGFGDPWLRIGALKMFLDGALGSRTAWLREPYAGTSDRGMQVMEKEEFRHNVQRAADAGLATVVHAIGDAAVDLALDVLGAPDVPRLALPHRIEHVQLCAPERFPQFAAHGIIASMQPAHLITDWRPAERHWGRERSAGAYAFRSLLKEGAILAFGSDVPVEPVDPRLGIFAAVERTDLAGEPDGGWFPDERLTVEETLRAYTVGPAYAAGVQHRSGTLTIGADADFVAWDRDPTLLKGSELLEMRCTATVVGGELVWDEEGRHT